MILAFCGCCLIIFIYFYVLMGFLIPIPNIGILSQRLNYPNTGLKPKAYLCLNFLAASVLGC